VSIGLVVYFFLCMKAQSKAPGLAAGASIFLLVASARYYAGIARTTMPSATTKFVRIAARTARWPTRRLHRLSGTDSPRHCSVVLASHRCNSSAAITVSKDDGGRQRNATGCDFEGMEGKKARLE
jgi:hypothetical protein